MYVCIDTQINDINKKRDGYICFDEFKDHMMELIKKGRYERRNRTESEMFQPH